MSFKRIVAIVAVLLSVVSVTLAQNAGRQPVARKGNSLTVVLSDASSDEAVAFATVSIVKSGEKEAFKYALSDSKGKAVISGLPAGKYDVKAELLGYKPFTKSIEIKADTDLGTFRMDVDSETLEAANVSATGNPIVVKKDTIEYNASSFKITENSMLEDLLKKLPGIEVGEDGSVTANGETIKKITIDGKTFFLDDPQLATKNLPAKIVEKVKVVQKKSEQSEFTGIDDGNEETIIDLSVRRGMMKGIFGNVSGGVGHDFLNAARSAFGGELEGDNGDHRYQAGSFVGKFTDKSQISLILNANNTNNRGFNDISGGMMQGMRGGGGGGGMRGGGGGGNGITESWMGGLNGAWNLFDNDMELGGNYVYNGSRRISEEMSMKTTYLDDGSSLIYNNGLGGKPGTRVSNSQGHRFGVRLEHKFSENTSILFQPQVNFGTGNFTDYSDFETFRLQDGLTSRTNDGFNGSFGDNSNWSTNGFFLFRQRLGLPGRTISFMGNYSFNSNSLDSYNQSATNTYNDAGTRMSDIVNQRIDQSSKGSSLSGRLVYTEPLGAGFYAEANYSYGWSRNSSDKLTYDSGPVGSFDLNSHPYNPSGELLNDTYTNKILNEYVNQSGGVNLQYQKDKSRAQIGMSVLPTHTHNETNGKIYDDKKLNWAPSAMLWFDLSESCNLRFFYRGNSSQPSTSQLMPVPDNSNPLNVSLGNPYLTPYFSHRMNSEFRMTNRKTFTTVNLNLEGGFVDSPIVSAVWYDMNNGAQYSLPVNGPSSGNASARLFINSPIAKSNFSIFSMTNGSYSQSSSYIGKSKFDMSSYDTDGDGLFDNYEKFHEDFPDLGKSDQFTQNTTRSYNFMQRLRLTYRNDFVELIAGGMTRMNKSTYTLSTTKDVLTWSNQVNGEMNWTIPGGIEFRADLRYNWYRGYTTPLEDEMVMNAELNKLLFKKKLTLALRAYDILGQSKNLSVTDASNYHQEVINNTLGRYVIVALTYRFGTFGGQRGQRGGGPGMGGPGGSGPGMGGPGGGPGGPPRR